ncbi:MAG TPA: hypothetical protein VMT57_00875 [Candidatus Thermoplasmatota archaeon]|nr:hypothetical protein [Candidatus Thermoplasmatota archaeon]
MATVEPGPDANKRQQRYLRISKLIILFAVIYALWIAIVIIGTFQLALGVSWAGLTIEEWVLSAIVLFVVFIVIEILFLIRLSLKKQREITNEVTPAQFIKGKEVHTFTIPMGAKGGIFSKTYITIDESSVLNLRYQITPPHELWGKKD